MLSRLQIVTVAAMLLFHFSIRLSAQSQTTGRIVGTVSDPTGAVIDIAEVSAVDLQTGEKRVVTTNAEGNYAFSFLSPGSYRVEVRAAGFSLVLFHDVRVSVTETATVNVQLKLAAAAGESVTVLAAASALNGPQLGRVVDSEMVSELPQATRNFTQILALSPGASVVLPDNTALGRNSLNISVNGARVTQNNFQINGIDANKIDTNSAAMLAVPAPETIQEFKVQTSLYDAAFGGAGGSVQTITRSGGNAFHGGVYDYFRNEALNANDPFLKAAGVARPILRRNVVGVLAGGPVRKDKSSFFISYQATRERNGGSRSSRSNVAIAKGLTDDRSAETLLATFNPLVNPSTPAAINPVSLALLNAKLPNGKFIIPTPQADGRYVGVDVSTYREDQFNINTDFQLGPRDRLSAKFFYSNGPQFVALTQANVPGFGGDRKQDNRLLSIQYVSALNSSTVNEARAGYSVIRQYTFARQPVRDVDMGISRSNAASYPGLGLIRIGPQTAGLLIGNGGTAGDNASLAITLADTLSMSRGKHGLRTGVSLILNRDTQSNNPNRRGNITFQSFNNFLTGLVNSSMIGDGILTRRMRLAEYSFFLQDDWAISSRLTFNLGLRYQLDLPPVERDGAIATFDPDLYKPRMEVDSRGIPVGPPAEGFVQAGNVPPGLDSPDIPNGSNSLFKSIDPNNIAPRVGFAYAPPLSKRLLVRAGYGIFYSRLSMAHSDVTFNTPPYYALSRSPGATVDFANPYYPLPSQDQFPTLLRGVLLTGSAFARGIRTPYFHQYNFGVQWQFTERLQFEAAYAGSCGRKLLRGMSINQARLGSPQRPIINAVTGQVITTNSPDLTNVALRTPYPGVESSGLQQVQSSGQSNYNSLQVSLAHSQFKGLQFLVSYTYSKSMDNGSGGSGSTGDQLETAGTVGNVLDPRVGRGLSDFDLTHRFVLSNVWKLPGLASKWQVSGIVSVMSGLPIDIVDNGAGMSFSGTSNWRPNWAPGADRTTAFTNIPTGYFFNPFAFTRPIVQTNQPIPSSGGVAIASAPGMDFGDVGRNILRGPRQRNVDIALTRRFSVRESSTAELRAEFFNLFNQINLSNPVSNVSTAPGFTNTGLIATAGDFGRISSTRGNPRLIQLALKLNW